MISMPGIVLAAGASSRMRQPKALLRLPTGVVFVKQIVRTLDDAGVTPIVIVTRQAIEADVRRELDGERCLVVVNPDPDRGQLSSLRVGLASLDSPGAVLMTLVDSPLVRVDTVAALVSKWDQTRAPLVRPVHSGRNGHPVIFGADAIAALLETDVAAGAKPVIRRFAAREAPLAVSDDGVLIDVDTAAEYDRLLNS